MQCLDCGVELQRKTRGRAPKRCPACYEIRRSWKPATSRICERCEKQFQGIRDQRFCGYSCARTADRQERRCPQCGETFQVTVASRKLLCGLSCLAAYSAALGSARARRHTCRVCGKEFTNNKGANRCCSRECGWELVRRLRPPPEDWVHWYFGSCSVCLEPLRLSRPFGPHTTCRLRECQLEANRRRSRAAFVPVPPSRGRCLECGAEFFAQKGTLFCSGKCSKAVTKRESRARRSGVYDKVVGHSQRVTFRMLWERDSRCHICGELCFRKKDTPLHPLAPTIDHVIPITKGGAHLMENAALAHRICNSFKSDNPLTPEIRQLCQQAVRMCRQGENGWLLYPRAPKGPVGRVRKVAA
jgi:endonuclease I